MQMGKYNTFSYGSEGLLNSDVLPPIGVVPRVNITYPREIVASPWELCSLSVLLWLKHMQILRMFSLLNEVILHNFLAFLPIQNGKI